MDCGREQLLSDVKRKVVFIQDAIASISKKQEKLYTSAVGAKSEIHAAISRQLEALRNREVWLLDQVDVMLRIQDQLLQEHLVCLLHELGGLQHLLEVSQCLEENREGFNEELAQTLSRLGLLHLQPIEDTTINFTADMASLRRALHDFGEIGAKRPRWSQDLDAGLSQKEDENPAFELSYSPSDWLIGKTTSLSYMSSDQSEDDFEIVDDDQSETDIEIVDADQYVSEPLAWPTVESVPTFAHIDELMRSPLTDWLSTDWLRDCGYDQTQDAEDIIHFKEVSQEQDIKSWLISNEQRMNDEGDAESQDDEDEDYDEEIDEEIDEDEEDGLSCSKPACACTATVQGPQFYEIENLAQLLCVKDSLPSKPAPNTRSFNSNKWLARSKEEDKEEKDICMQDEDEYEKSLPNVEKACRANEPCRDFSECLFDTNCCLNDSNGSPDWLGSSGGTCCQKWNEDQGLSEKSREFDSWLIQSSSHVSKNKSDWLAFDSVTIPTAVDMPSPIDGFLNQQSNNVSDWLVSESKHDSQDSVANSIESYFEQLSNKPSDWLVKEEQYPSTSLVSPLESYFKLRSECESDWLINTKTESPQCLEAETTFYAISASVSTNWLFSAKSDHDQSPSTPMFNTYFESRSDEPSDWLARSNEKSASFSEINRDSPVGVYMKERSEKLSDWLVCEKGGSQVAPEKYSDWLPKENADTEMSEKSWLISEKMALTDNKDFVEELSHMINQFSISTAKNEPQTNRDPWLAESPSDPVANSSHLFPCFNEEMDVKRWLVA